MLHRKVTWGIPEIAPPALQRLSLRFRKEKPTKRGLCLCDFAMCLLFSLVLVDLLMVITAMALQNRKKAFATHEICDVHRFDLRSSDVVHSAQDCYLKGTNGRLNLETTIIRKAPDTFILLRHVMRAIWSVRPKCSHRCVSLKETPLKPVQILKHTTKNSTEQTVMRTKWFKHIAI